MAQQPGNRVISSPPRLSGYPGATIGQPQVLVFANLGRDPAYITCPFCKMQTVTKIEFKPNSRTHAIAYTGAVQNNCCMCLPYCMDDLQSAHHYCALCGAFIGKCD